MLNLMRVQVGGWPRRLRRTSGGGRAYVCSTRRAIPHEETPGIQDCRLAALAKRLTARPGVIARVRQLERS